MPIPNIAKKKIAFIMRKYCDNFANKLEIIIQ